MNRLQDPRRTAGQFSICWRALAGGRGSRSAGLQPDQLRRIVCWLLMTVMFPGAARAGDRGLVLAQDGKSRYRIVRPVHASAATQSAAIELQRLLKEMTGAELKLVGDDGPPGRFEILLGDNAHTRALGVLVDTARLGDEGYILRTVGNHLVIAGRDVRGTMYGVYGLLEDHLGCRWFTPARSRIPSCRTRPDRRLSIGPLDQTVVPVFEYRDPFVYDCLDARWSMRNRMNGSWQLKPEHGGGARFGAGLFVHTFDTLLPPEKHFDVHPEYFAEVGGRRVKHRTQLCCTNEEVIRLVTAALRERIREAPDATIYSVSQNDWGNYCQCPRCRQLADQEGSPAAPLLHLVNRVAQEFPEKTIETLAYQWSRKPPRTLTPRPNVIIRLCSIECCFAHPLDECDRPENRAFVADLRGWTRICRRVWVWNYETNFAHYLLPFPNYHVWEKNIRLFARHGVRGVLTQDNYQSPHGELSALGGYVRAKLLWNPDADARAVTDEFLQGVYGPAAPFIRAYLELLSRKVLADNIHLRISDHPTPGYLTADILARADHLWDQAEEAVTRFERERRQVRIDRASLDYAFIEQARHQGGTSADPRLAARIKRFTQTIQEAGITHLREGNGDVPAYLSSLDFLWKPRP